MAKKLFILIILCFPQIFFSGAWGLTHNSQANCYNNEDTNYNDKNEENDSLSIIDPFSGTYMQPGTVIVNDGFNGTNEFEKKSLVQFGIDQSKWEVEKRKDINSLAENGFIEVDKEKIPNIEGHYEKYKDELYNLEEVEEKISFYPERVEDVEYKLLGVSPSGTIDEEGLSSSLVRLYESPLGKIIINEEDLESSNTIVSLDKDFLNIEIGESPTSLISMKSKETEDFFTEIYWINNTKNRAYTVEINSNLNDETNLEKKENLLKFLTKNFESQIK